MMNIRGIINPRSEGENTHDYESFVLRVCHDWRKNHGIIRRPVAGFSFTFMLAIDLLCILGNETERVP